MGTKERILQEALLLFAHDGYEGVSIREIASSVGVTKGAIYRHYPNKQAIFDSIVSRMEEVANEEAEKFEVSIEDLNRNEMIKTIKDFTISQFVFWTENEFASNFKKMLIIEQFRNTKMADLLWQYLTGGVVDYTQMFIQELARMSNHQEVDVEVLALEYIAPLHLIMNLYTNKQDKQRAVNLLEKHIHSFLSVYLSWEEETGGDENETVRIDYRSNKRDRA
ncbi:transcriptional regulator, TetR family [Pilibacter termitis]|uniref:Transcriptional regulator, TetR family n=1 Tax=Pilibacter termitis TaxID=263852 RepID=A0A1T4M479_9ENTE|nr:TetR/AcrR family transcriptional regulator [Pilibacter termitis]SJZ61588.1 transcriptional regulator, TetR family [Pilibacter termitis]